jgi:hypothetical protein
MERKELECVKGASSQPALNFVIRYTTWAFRRSSAFPQLLDSNQFKFVGRTPEKSSDVKKFLIPDCNKESVLIYEAKKKMLTCHIAITKVMSICQLGHNDIRIGTCVH